MDEQLDDLYGGIECVKSNPWGRFRSVEDLRGKLAR
jgi:hypothetical protein